MGWPCGREEAQSSQSGTLWRVGQETSRKLRSGGISERGKSGVGHAKMCFNVLQMAEGAGCISDFSKIYRQRAHENQRIGMTPHSIPSVEEVDKMVKHSERIQVSLARMREVVLNHQQACVVEPPQDARYRHANGYDQDAQGHYSEDGKNGASFAGPDNKKRRGVSLLRCRRLTWIPTDNQLQRAAPPGRCHSCNRAETPEWRRGPDGARTLCNACGLRKCSDAQAYHLS